MKLFIVLVAVALAQAAKLDRVYLPPNAQTSAGSGNFLQTPQQSFIGSQTRNAYSNVPAFNRNTYTQNDYSGPTARSERPQEAFEGNTAAFSSTQAGKLNRAYLPPNARASTDSVNFLQTTPQSYNGGQAQNGYSSAPAFNTNAYSQSGYSNFESRPERAQAAIERSAAILRQDSSNDGETYSYAYETENGIQAEESGVATNGVQAQGSYSYTGDDGKVYSVRYTADENGFVPQGDHIPEAIIKSLEQNARDATSDIYDDGSYSDAKYDSNGNNQQQYYNTNAQPINYNEDSVVTNSAALRNAATSNSQSIQKSYLPPVTQRSQNGRNGNYNARSGYSY